MDHLLLLFILIHHGGGMVHGHNLYHIMYLITLKMQFQEGHNHLWKSHFDETNRLGFQEKKKVVKQVYWVKRDNHKDKSSDLPSSDKKLNVTTTTSANIGKDVKQQVGDAQGAKFEPMKLEVSKAERKLSMPKSEAQPSHPLGLPNWPMRKLQKLNVAPNRGGRGSLTHGPVATVPCGMGHWRAGPGHNDMRFNCSNDSNRNSNDFK
jgi:hypothetical protein